jgi:CBS domain containing-hemolysin-like protein
VSAPFIHALNGAGNAAVRLLGLPPPDHLQDGHSSAELRRMLHESHRTGNLEASERQLLDNAFEFADRTVRQVMRPRGETVYIALDEPLDAIIERVRKTGYTRYPLCTSDMDEVVGFIHVKDLLFPAAPFTGAEDLLKLKRDILFVPEMIGIPALLAQMRRAKMMIAVAVDEYGVVTGLCTMEDILEVLVGEIQDEHDQEHPLIRPTRDGGFLVEGTTLISEIGRRLMLDIKFDGGDTIAGYMLQQLGRMARDGDSITVHNYLVRVVEMKGFRIVRLLVTPVVPPTAQSSIAKDHAGHTGEKDPS